MLLAVFLDNMSVHRYLQRLLARNVSRDYDRRIEADKCRQATLVVISALIRVYCCATLPLSLNIS